MSETTSAAQATPVAEPQKEHRWLRRFLGEWSYKVATQPGQPAHEMTGTESVRAIGELWIVAEAREGPSMADDGTMSTYQDVIEFKNDNHRVLTSRAVEKDGTLSQPFMSVEYRRV
jgi:hypothetical protein